MCHSANNYGVQRRSPGVPPINGEGPGGEIVVLTGGTQYKWACPGRLFRAAASNPSIFKLSNPASLLDTEVEYGTERVVGPVGWKVNFLKPGWIYKS